MSYNILPYTIKKAKMLGVEVYVSDIAPHKIDVYKNGHKVASIGDVNYYDYPTYIKEFGIKYANERRKLYRIRHKKELSKVGSPGWYAANLLW